MLFLTYCVSVKWVHLFHWLHLNNSDEKMRSVEPIWWWKQNMSRWWSQCHVRFCPGSVSSNQQQHWQWICRNNGSLSSWKKNCKNITCTTSASINDTILDVLWWRHQMETFSALLALCAGNSPVPVNSPHKGQWREALMFSLICARINDWVNNREAGDLRRHRGHYDVIVMLLCFFSVVESAS